MERISEYLGEKLVDNEGKQKVGLRRALSLWTEHIFWRIYDGGMEVGKSGHTVGRFKKPTVTEGPIVIEE